MGLLRLFLAVAVVLGHAPGWGGFSPELSFYGLKFIHPYYAVQAFFTISGFYMALVLTEKYSKVDRGTLRFYASRYLRLAPTYWFICLVTIGFILVFRHTNFQHNCQVIRGQYPVAGNGRDLALFVLALVMNITLMGQDVASLFGLTQIYGTCFLLIPQAWSIGTELCFYLLAPFLNRLRTRTLLVLVAVSLASRFITRAAGLPFWPWQQRFLPSELFFFLLGILSYRAYRRYRSMSQPEVLNKRLCYLAGAALCCFVALAGWSHKLNRLCPDNSIKLGLLLFALLPFVFHGTRTSAIDRFIGYFTYPVYLWHICIAYFIHAAQVYWRGGMLLFLAILFSVPTVLLIERPLERWRGGLVRRGRPRSTEAEGDEGAPSAQPARAA